MTPPDTTNDITTVTRERMPWVWLDPLRSLRHHINKTTYRTFSQTVYRVSYVTWCGHLVSVDDINPKTQANDAPTCFRCIVATPLEDVINVQE
jgi:hypothetical protein